MMRALALGQEKPIRIPLALGPCIHDLKLPKSALLKLQS